MAHPDDYRALAYAARAIPMAHGLRPYSVAFSTESYDADDDGSAWAGPNPILMTEAGGANPLVEFERFEDVTSGVIPPDIFKVRITPVGTNLEILTEWLEPVTRGESRHLILYGPGLANGKRYRVLSIDATKAIHWTVRAQSEDQLLHGFG